LPSKGTSLEVFLEDFFTHSWKMVITALSFEQGEIVLPRFTISFGSALSKVLEQLGMAIAFDAEHANFKPMCHLDHNIYLTEVYHHTFTEVNETGTEAGAVTIKKAAVLGIPDDPFTMIVDRPFLFAIRDTHTGGLFFIGCVSDPQ
jgi:serpin B